MDVAEAIFAVKTDCPVSTGADVVDVEVNDPFQYAEDDVNQWVTEVFDDVTVRESTNASSQAVWTPDLDRSGLYRVSVLRASSSNPDDTSVYTTRARYTIHHEDGQRSILVNQNDSINGQNVLGVFPFRCGTEGSVILTNSGQNTLQAAALRFEWLPESLDEFAFLFVRPEQLEKNIASDETYRFEWYITPRSPEFEFDLHVTEDAESVRDIYDGNSMSLQEVAVRLNPFVLQNRVEDHRASYLHTTGFPVVSNSGTADLIPVVRIRDPMLSDTLYFGDDPLPVQSKKDIMIDLEPPENIQFGQAFDFQAFVNVTDDGSPVGNLRSQLIISGPAGFERIIEPIFVIDGVVRIPTVVYETGDPGTWLATLQTSAESPQFAPASRSVGFTLSEAGSRLRLFGLGARHLLGEDLVFAGRLELLNGNPGDIDLSGLDIDILLMTPDGDPVALPQAAVNTDRNGEFTVTVAFDEGILDEEGRWTLQARYDGGHPGITGSESEEFSVPVGAKQGYAILVLGGIDGGEGIDDHRRTLEYVKDVMVGDEARGFVDDTTAPNSETDDIFEIYVDDQSSLGGRTPEEQLEHAITVWAEQKMLAAPAPLYIVLINHGDENAFHIDFPVGSSLDSDQSTLDPGELDAAIATLESSLDGASNPLAGDSEIIVVLGMCYSGSFMEELAAPNRIILSASAQDERSIRGPGADTDRHGEYFVYLLFRELSNGASLLDGFAATRDLIRQVSSTFDLDTNDSGSPDPFFPGQRGQHPLLEDDGMPPFGSFRPGNGNELPLLFAEVNARPDENKVHSIFLDVKRPAAAQIFGTESMQADLDLVEQPMEQDQTVVTNRVHWTWTGTDSEQDSELFSGFGEYQVLYYAVQNVVVEESDPIEFRPGQHSKPLISYVYRASGTATPQAFGLLTPDPNATDIPVVDFFVAEDDIGNEAFTWEPSASTAGHVNYIVRFWLDENREELAFETRSRRHSHYVLERDLVFDRVNDPLMPDYWWDVVAVDIEGNAVESTELGRIRVLRSNNFQGQLAVEVSDLRTGGRITDIAVGFEDDDQELLPISTVKSANENVYTAWLTNRTYVVTVTASGYDPVVVNDVTINADFPTLQVLLHNDPPEVSQSIGDVVDLDTQGQRSIDLFTVFEDMQDADSDLVFEIVVNTNALLFEQSAIVASDESARLVLDYKLNAPGNSDITIRATDRGGLSIDHQFVVTVENDNDPPIAVPDQFSVIQGGRLVADDAVGSSGTATDDGVLVNDLDVDGDPLTAVLVAGPNNHCPGTFTLNDDGTFVFDHDGVDTETVSFTYAVSDGQTDEPLPQATVMITIVPDSGFRNPAITTCPEATMVPADSLCRSMIPDLTEHVTATDKCHSVEMVSVTQDPIAGTVMVGPQDAVVLITAANSSGNSTTCTVTVSVGDFVPPEIVNCPADRTLTAEGNCEAVIPDLMTDVVASDSCDSLIAGVMQMPEPGTRVVVSVGQTVLLTVRDAAGNSSTCSVALRVRASDNGWQPVGDSYAVDEGGALVADDAEGAGTFGDPTDDSVLVNDLDRDGASTVVLIDGPLHHDGSEFLLNPDGTFTYRHDGSETTSDGFTYAITDAVHGCRTASVTIVVGAENDPPEGAADSYVVVRGEGVDASDAEGIDGNSENDGVLVNDIDPDSEQLTANLVSPPQHHSGQFMLDPNGTFDYDHNGSSARFDQFTYRAFDGIDVGDETTVTITIHDPVPPEITECASDQTLAPDVNCEVFLPDLTDDATASDNLDTILVVTQLPAPGTVLPVGETTAVQITVADSSDNTDTCMATVFVDGWICQYGFRRGWNLLSFPGPPGQPDFVDNVVGGVFTWDGATMLDAVETELEANQGYFMYIGSRLGMVTVCGESAVSSQTLLVGWNLVGVPREVDLVDYPAVMRPAWRWNGTEFVAEFGRLEPCVAYWVLLQEETTFP